MSKLAYSHRHRLLIAVLLAALLIVAGVDGRASGAEPATIETLDGSCDHTKVNSTVTGTPVSSSHDTLVQVQGSTGSGEFMTPHSGTTYFHPGDVVWVEGGSLAAGDSPSLTVRCPSGDATFTVTFADRPVTPATFSAAGVTGSFGTFGFSAPAGGTYVADIAISQGTIAVATAQEQTFSSNGQYVVGTWPRGGGLGALRYRVVNGSPAEFTVTIHPTTGAVSALRGPTYLAPPPGGNTATFHLSGPATVSAALLRPDGAKVRTITTGQSLDAGDPSLSWPSTDDAGAPLADGSYMLTVTASDYAGTQTSVQTPVALDTTAPVVTLDAARVAPQSPVTIRGRDAVSGTASMTLTVDGSAQGIYKSDTISYVPQGGWSPGSHTLTVFAADKAGNHGATTLALTATRAAPMLTAAQALGKLKRILRARGLRAAADKRLRARCVPQSASVETCRFSSRTATSTLTGRGTLGRSATNALRYRLVVTVRRLHCSARCTRRARISDTNRTRIPGV